MKHQATMKAVAAFHPLPIDHAEALLDVEVPTPKPGPRDLLVRVHAVSVNPVDTKMRRASSADGTQPRVLGWDAVGIVEAVGAQVRHHRAGDRVWYAGSIARAGSNAELQLVDERIAGRAPASLDDVAAAALPLTAITAWELLFDRLKVPRGGGAGQSLLVVGGAGGVGSILIQLARELTQLKVIATASRDDSRAWCLHLGAHAVVDHAQPLAPQLVAIGVPAVDHVASLTQTHQHFDELVEALKPQGQLALIDDPEPLDIRKLKRKSLSLHWELMFTRSLFETADLDRQRELLDEVATLVDAGRLRSTAREALGTVSAATLRQAHALVESGRAIGKVVLKGY